MMTKLFNSSFEVSLRVVLLLSQIGNADMTLDRIVGYDFISLYSRYFDLVDINLHGDNEFGFSELSARRVVVQAALKNLVLDGLVKANRLEGGFCYEITDAGSAFCKKQISDYANTYRNLVISTHKKYENVTEVELMAVISRKATQALRR
jgi:hypothetical protein